MAGSTRDVTYALRINTDDAKGKIPEVTGEAKASLEGLSSSTVKSGEDFQTWGQKVQEAAAGTGTMEVSVTELAQALATGKINIDQYKAALGPIKDAEDAAALALGRFVDAMGKLGAAEENPRRLGKAVVTAQVSVEALSKSLQALGKPIPPEMEASLKRAQVEIDRLNAKAGVYRDTAGDMAVKQKLAAQGMETMAARGGSLQGILGGLADSSGVLGSSLAKVGLATFGVIEAWKLGWESGNKLRELWKDMTGKEMPSLTNWFVKLGTGIDDATGAFDRHGVVARSMPGIHNAHAQAISALTARIVALVPEWNKEADALKTSGEFAKVFASVLKEMVADHQDVAKYGKEHANSIIEALAPALKAGTISVATMTTEMRLAVRAALDASDAHKKEAESIANATAKIKEKLDAQTKSIAQSLLAAEKDVEAAQTSISAIYKRRDAEIKALKEMELSDEEYNKRKSEINKKAADDVEDATEKETAALGKVEDAYADHRKSVAESEEATKKATTAAEEQAKAYDQVRDAMANVDKAFDEVKQGSSSSAAEIGKAGEAIASLGPISELAKGRLKALRDEMDELTKAAKRAQDALAGGETFPGGPI